MVSANVGAPTGGQTERRVQCDRYVRLIEPIGNAPGNLHDARIAMLDQ
jgi:hypothetical protein